MFKSVRKRYYIIFICAVLLFFLFPYSGDDWAWGSTIGLQRLMNGFKNYNGRYLGNIIALVLTRSRVVRAACMAFCVTGIVYLAEELTNESRYTFLILTALLLMPVSMFRQSIAWTSGFANYGTSIFLTLVALKILSDGYTSAHVKGDLKKYIMVFLLGAANALIVEHLTIYNFLMSLFFIFCFVYNRRKPSPLHICYLSGVLVGAVFMFSNTSYTAPLDTGRYVHSIGTIATMIDRFKTNFLDTIIKDGFQNNIVLNFILLMACLQVWVLYADKMDQVRQKSAAVCMMVNTFVYTILTIICFRNDTFRNLGKYIQGLMTVIFIISLAYFLFILPVKKERRNRLLFYLCSICIVIAPLSVVQPIGPRCFFAGYVFEILLILELLNEIPYSGRSGVFSCVRCVLLVVTIASFSYLLAVYGKIYIYDIKRVEKAKTDSLSESVITVNKLPYKDYIWMPEPTNGTLWETRFKLFHGISEDVEIINR